MISLTSSRRASFILTVFAVFTVSISSGIHRALLSILYQEITGASLGARLLGDAQAPLEVWITLALSLAPFGLAKSIADWIGGLGSDKWSGIAIMRMGGITFLLAIFTVLISIFSHNIISGEISGIFLGLATGFFGLAEGLFYVSATLRLTNLSSSNSRGFSVGLMESAVYSGYTVGAIVNGFFSQNAIDLVTPYLFGIIITAFTIVVTLLQSRVTQKKTPEEIKLKIERQRYSLRLFIARPRVAAIFLFAHIGKFADAFVWILPLFLTTKVLTLDQNPDYLWISLIISLYTASWAIMMLISSKVSDWIGRKWLVLGGFWLASVGLFGLSYFSDKLLLMLFGIILGLGTGFFYPILTVIAIDIVVRPVQGEMIGMLRSLRDLGYFTAPFIVCILAFILGGKLSDLSKVGVIISLLLFLAAIFQLILLRESRPPWHRLDLIISHAKLVEKTVKTTCEAFLADNIHNKINIVQIVQEAEKLEHDADVLKREIRKSLMQSILPSADDSLFLDILRVNDQIAGRAVISVTKLKYIPVTQIPDSITMCLVSIASSLPELIHELVNSMELLEEKIYLAVLMTKDISKLESKIDHDYSRTLYELYKNEDQFNLNGRFTTMTTIKECAEALENCADYIEHSADLISVLGDKYRP